MEILRVMFPPKPSFTEKDVTDQAGKVFLITGASSGVGAALAKILYSANAKVYVAARSEQKAQGAIDAIKAAHPDSRGQLIFHSLDLADLATIRRSAEAFLAAEQRLDVLWLNAGVMIPPQGSKTAQGWELQLGTNNLGHFLFARYLRPALQAAATTAPKGSVRIVWVSSSAVDIPGKPAIDFENINYDKKNESSWMKYGRSKVGNVLHSMEFARRFEKDGIVSVALNPGNLKTDLQRHVPAIIRWLMDKTILYEARYGAYTELFAGLSPNIGIEQSGAWLQPWGRIVALRKDLQEAQLASKYWAWSEEQTKAF